MRRAGGAVTFRAGRELGAGTVTAAANGGALTAAASVIVRPATLRIGAVTFRGTSRGIEVTVGAVDGARRPVSRAALTIVAARRTTGASPARAS